jgi:hypothetical protein
MLEWKDEAREPVLVEEPRCANTLVSGYRMDVHTTYEFGVESDSLVLGIEFKPC